MSPLSALLGLTLCAASAAAQFPVYQNVVSLGDSMFDDSSGNRSPLASEQIAMRLGAPLTQLAKGKITSTELLASGQIEAAVASFGPGDLALLWVGSNDMLQNFSQVAVGNLAFLDTLEANMNVAVAALTGAGMDVLVFNLPDFAFLPRVQLMVPPALYPNFTAASSEWHNRLQVLAAGYGAGVADAFGYSQAFMADPAAFAVGGTTPVGAPSFGSLATCPYCIFFDPIHPTALGQGFYANQAIADFNAFFDPGGSAPLPPLSNAELQTLVAALPATYCSAKLSSPGCLPQIGFSGSPSLSAPSSFDITANQVVSNKSGILFYGYGSAALPFLGGTLCVAPPLRRLSIQNAGGNPPPDDCSGSFSFDFNQHLASGIDTTISVGDELWAQYWFRDPADATGFGAGLSDGLAFAVLP